MADIKFDRHNYRKHSDRNKELIRKSLDECGAGRSILIDSENEIIAGNGVYEQAKEQGIPVKVIETDGSELVVVKRTDLKTDDERRKKLALADNATADHVEWDAEALGEDWGSDELGEWGIELGEDVEIADEGGEAEEDDFDEAADKVEARCQRGDIWLLGNHRLMCGDSTSQTDVAELMDGAKADMVFTDPPYGIKIVNTNNGSIGGGNLAKVGVYAPIIGDETTQTAQKSISVAESFCENMMIWGGNYFIDFLPKSNGWIIWDKRGKDEIRNNFADGEMMWCSFHTPLRIYHHLWFGMIQEGVREQRVHPTQKPVILTSNILSDFTSNNDKILDLFGGSGSTLIACEQLNRQCYMMELDPHYCDVIIARWEKLTGKQATKI